jgi:hypothetical protein
LDPVSSVTAKLDGLNEDFRDLLVLLADHGVDFVIVGAYALGFHGAPRASGDIDLLVRPSQQNAERALQALTEFGAPLSSHGVTPADLARPGTVYQLGVAPRRIDILTQISGVEFDEAWESRVPSTVEDRVVHFIGREAYLKNKDAAGRPKDIADAARLRSHKER